MCLTIYCKTEKEAEKLNPKRAKEDIVVYKLLIAKKSKNNTYVKGEAPYRWGFYYDKGFHYYNGKNSLKKKIREGRWFVFGNAIRVEIHEGLHSYKQNIPLMGLVKMVVPKGAYYYENGSEIVSTDLIWY